MTSTTADRNAEAVTLTDDQRKSLDHLSKFAAADPRVQERSMMLSETDFADWLHSEMPRILHDWIDHQRRMVERMNTDAEYADAVLTAIGTSIHVTVNEDYETCHDCLTSVHPDNRVEVENAGETVIVCRTCARYGRGIR